MRVAQRGDREPAEEVEVLLALAVPELHALAAHERDRETAVGLHAVLGVELSDVLECVGVERAHGNTIVPMPSRVKNSSSSACGMRPSRMCARRTPPRSAERHDSSLGIIPPSAFPVASSSSSPAASMPVTRLDSSGYSA